jgi:hypothetical protein
MSILTRTLLSLILILITVNISKSQVYEKGNVVIDGYYGFPNLMFYKWNSSTSKYEEYSDARSTSIGPIGGRVEYLLGKKIGIGLDGSFAYTIINYDFEDSYSNNLESYKLTVARFRFIPRFNLHFGNHSKADPYISGGIGYYYRKIVFSPNNPAEGYYNPYTFRPFGPNWPFDNALLLPIAFTAKFGFRYFLNDKIGLGAEVGLGGPAITFGITAKLK